MRLFDERDHMSESYKKLASAELVSPHHRSRVTRVLRTDPGSVGLRS
jgi:hypothetical protein